jgi:hypothetical protein
MNQVDKQTKEIIDFIYDKPQLIVPLLQKYGYDIQMDTASLQQIYEQTFDALSVKKNIDFSKELDSLILNEGYVNVAPLVVMAGASLASSVVGGLFGGRQAKKQRELMVNLKLAELSTNEKIAYEKIKTEAETERLRIFSNTLLQYRQTLQQESTTRLKDTWIYVVGLGLAVGIIYGVSLIVKKD